MIPFRFVKTANVSVGGTTINAPGSANMPGSGYSSVSAGAANIPGMSIHCLRCGREVKQGMPRCPACGNDISRVAQDDPGSPDTGPTETVSPAQGVELGNGMGGADIRDPSMGKYSSAAGTLAPELLKALMGGGLVAGTGLTTAILAPTFRQGEQEQRKFRTQQLVLEGKLPESEMQKFQHVLEKQAERKGANPILSVRLALKKFRNASGKYRASMVFGKK